MKDAPSWIPNIFGATPSPFANPKEHPMRIVDLFVVVAITDNDEKSGLDDDFKGPIISYIGSSKISLRLSVLLFMSIA
jgi:hypothetical protein